jgi:hypothetical protein
LAANISPVAKVAEVVNGDMDHKMAGFDPIAASQLTSEKIKRGERLRCQTAIEI